MMFFLIIAAQYITYCQTQKHKFEKLTIFALILAENLSLDFLQAILHDFLDSFLKFLFLVGRQFKSDLFQLYYQITFVDGIICVDGFEEIVCEGKFKDGVNAALSAHPLQS